MTNGLRHQYDIDSTPDVITRAAVLAIAIVNANPSQLLCN